MPAAPASAHALALVGESMPPSANQGTPRWSDGREHMAAKPAAPAGPNGGPYPGLVRVGYIGDSVT